jgi:hypothetical protein
MLHHGHCHHREGFHIPYLKWKIVITVNGTDMILNLNSSNVNQDNPGEIYSENHTDLAGTELGFTTMNLAKSHVDNSEKVCGSLMNNDIRSQILCPEYPIIRVSAECSIKNGSVLPGQNLL